MKKKKKKKKKRKRKKKEKEKKRRCCERSSSCGCFLCATSSPRAVKVGRVVCNPDDDFWYYDGVKTEYGGCSSKDKEADEKKTNEDNKRKMERR